MKLLENKLQLGDNDQQKLRQEEAELELLEQQ